MAEGDDHRRCMATHPPSSEAPGRTSCAALLAPAWEGQSTGGQRENCSTLTSISPVAWDTQCKQFVSQSSNQCVHPEVPTGTLSPPLPPSPGTCFNFHFRKGVEPPPPPPRPPPPSISSQLKIRRFGTRWHQQSFLRRLRHTLRGLLCVWHLPNGISVPNTMFPHSQTSWFDFTVGPLPSSKCV